VTRFSREAGFTLIELLIVIAIVGLLAMLAMAGYRFTRIRTAEAAAVSDLTAINRAQFLYMQSCGRQRYAPTLVELGTAPPGEDRGFISPDLATADPLQKGGYLYQLSGTQATDVEGTCTGATPLERYVLIADPIRPGNSGVRFFGTNTDRIIYADATTFAGSMPETGAPGHGEEIR
jgi:prepilin-type N-terminal cleavage/methylation domain-containing protein